MLWFRAKSARGNRNKSNSSQAILELEAATPYELGEVLYPAYVRGQAYLQAHNGSSAAAEFQKMMNQRFPIGSAFASAAAGCSGCWSL